MLSTGLFIKEDELILVLLKQGMRHTLLADHDIIALPAAKGEERDELLLNQINRFFKAHPGCQDNLFLAIPRDKVIMQPVYMPLAAEENLRTALGYEMDRLTPFSADAVYYDYFILKRLPAKNQIYLILVAVKKEVVDYYLALLKRIGVRPRGIEITSTALFNIYQAEHNGAEKPLQINWLQQNKIPASLRKALPWLFAGHASARIPEEKTIDTPLDVLVAYVNGHCEINLVSDGMLFYSRSIVVPSRHAATSAEQTDGLSWEELFKEVQRGMLSIPEHKDQERPLRFFLTGRTLSENYLVAGAAQESVEIHRLQDFPQTVVAGADDHTMPLLVIPLSLALKGLRRMPLDINLIPAALRPKKKRSKKKIAALLTGGVIVVAAAVVLVQNILTTQARIAELDVQLAELKAQAQAVDAMQKEIDLIEKARSEIQQIKDLTGSKLLVLEELTKIIPDDSWLTDFDFNADEKKVTLSGYSTSASKLIPILEESRLFTNVKFTSPITKGAGVKENFKIEMTLEAAKP